MPITEKQRERRRKHLGSSDMAAILGVDPYRNKYDVWLDKTGKVSGTEANEAMQIGSALEPVLLDMAQGELGKLLRNQRRVLGGTPLASNIDAITFENEPVEAKTSGMVGPLAAKWGEFGTDEVPDAYVIQAHVHMLVMKGEPPVCHIPALLGGRGFGIYCVTRNPDLLEVILEQAELFWTNHVLADAPPEDVYPHLEVVRKARREPNKLVSIPADLVSRYERMKKAEAIIRKRTEDAQAAVLAQMGDAELADFGDETRQIIYLETDYAGYTVKPSKRRSLRIVKRRKELPAPTEGESDGE